LPVVLYGREIRSVILREEHTLSVFENRVLMRISELMGDENIGYLVEKRKNVYEELHNLYSSPNIISMIKSRRIR
jgi:hypothetical protein